MTSHSSPRIPVLILAGGRGERLQSEFPGPKPLAPIGDTPFLHYQIELLLKQGFRRIHLLLGHQAEAIQSYVQKKNYPSAEFQFSTEPVPLGTAGAIRFALEQFSYLEDFLVINGDTFFDADYAQLPPNSLALTYFTPQSAFGQVRINADYLVENFIEKKSHHEGHINAGVYRFKRNFFLSLRVGQPVSLEQEMLPQLAKEKKLHAYPLPGKFIDIGTPSNFQLAQKEIPYWQNLPKRPCLFLDRDGVLIRDKKYLGDPAQVELLPDAPSFLHWASQFWPLKIVLTNQAGIGRGHFSLEQFHQVTRQVESLYRKQQINFDQCYFCPDHPTHGQGQYLKDTPLRKPGAGMLLLASQDFAIDFSKSVMIGDKDSDVLQVLGPKTYLIQGDYPIHRNSSILFADFKSIQKQLAQDFALDVV